MCICTLTGSPLRIHVTFVAGYDAPDVQLAFSISSAAIRCFSTSIIGSNSGTSGS